MTRVPDVAAAIGDAFRQTLDGCAARDLDDVTVIGRRFAQELANLGFVVVPAAAAKDGDDLEATASIEL